MKTYTIHRGTVRTSEALFTHRLGIYERQDRARFNLSALDRHSPAHRAAETELKNATARADEASKMHLVPFVTPYVPAKASRVYPALKTCTSPRRALRMKGRVALADNGYYPYPGGYAGGAVQWGTFTAASGRNEWSERSQERALRAKNMALFGSDIAVR